MANSLITIYHPGGCGLVDSYMHLHVKQMLRYLLLKSLSNWLLWVHVLLYKAKGLYGIRPPPPCINPRVTSLDKVLEATRSVQSGSYTQSCLFISLVIDITFPTTVQANFLAELHLKGSWEADVKLYILCSAGVCSCVHLGFRNDDSTIQQLLLFYHQAVWRDLSSPAHWDVIFLNFGKGFCLCVTQQTFVQVKVNWVFLGTSALVAMLSVGKISVCVCIGVSGSAPLPVVLRMPREGVLSSLLFIVHINDPLQCVTSTLLYMVCLLTFEVCPVHCLFLWLQPNPGRSQLVE